MSNTLKEFDQKATNIYSEIIGKCKEFVNGEVDEIYVIGLNEGNSHFQNDVFYKVNQEIYEIHTVANKIGMLISNESMYDLLDKLKVFKELYSLYDEYTGEIPTEVRMKYSCNTGRFGMNISYDKRIENSSTLSTQDVIDSWIADCRLGNDGFDW